MNTGKYVFSQIILHLPARVFDRCVEHYDGNKYVKHFTCWSQLLCMMFGQLSGRDSLRDLLVSISPHKSKFYHLGFGKNVSKTNLAFANEKRDYRIFEEFAYAMIKKARSCSLPDSDFKLDIAGPVYAFDSTLIDLCLKVFWWAEFRTAKAAIKIHTLIDVKTSIPCFVHITDGATHDVNGLDALKYENGGFYVLDRGYFDFKRLFNINTHGAYFITRSRNKLAFNRVTSRKVKKKKGILCDQTITLSNFYPSEKYPIPLRRIRFYDKETDKRFVFITNNFELPAENVALLYKYRWRIELFFKWIKQHLKVKSFWGTTENAVRIQIYSAIITYTLIIVIKNKLKSLQSNYEILQILSISLLDKEPLKGLLSKSVNQDVKERNYDQLKFDLF
jgi:FOG: Transposase and inactivated derivatives